MNLLRIKELRILKFYKFHLTRLQLELFSDNKKTHFIIALIYTAYSPQSLSEEGYFRLMFVITPLKTRLQSCEKPDKVYRNETFDYRFETIDL